MANSGLTINGGLDDGKIQLGLSEFDFGIILGNIGCILLDERAGIVDLLLRREIMRRQLLVAPQVRLCVI